MEQNIKKKSQSNKFSVNWDYTKHADHYDKRADYSEKAIDKLVEMLEREQENFQKNF